MKTEKEIQDYIQERANALFAAEHVHGNMTVKEIDELYGELNALSWVLGKTDYAHREGVTALY